MSENRWLKKIVIAIGVGNLAILTMVFLVPERSFSWRNPVLIRIKLWKRRVRLICQINFPERIKWSIASVT